MSSTKLLISTYQNVRKITEELCYPLMIEDYLIQTMDDVSPPKWHLAHTTWFFETFILKDHGPAYKIFNASYHYLFNSYYQTVGLPYPRGRRGCLARPTIDEVFQYREYVDDAMINFLEHLNEEIACEIKRILTLGLHHEQQHQELLLMDIKHNYSEDPSFPVYQKMMSKEKRSHIAPMKFVEMVGGLVEIGHKQTDEFCFDNELPAHQVILRPFSFANRLVTVSEYLEFMDAGGYEKPDYWLSDGWEHVHKQKYHAPAYWQQIDKEWYIFTLNGLQPLNLSEPVSHISYYEADAYARFCGARLPLEVEWEHMATHHQLSSHSGNFLENKTFHPLPLSETPSSVLIDQLFGDLWEWTASPYCPYPGFKPLKGALGEYNGKFMSNQMVLRGGSCITPKSHVRASYRNFFGPDKRWFFSGIRLAK